MRCSCGGETRVIDGRHSTYLGDQLFRRRRACEACGGRFTTYEAAIDLKAMLRLRRSRVLNLRQFKARMSDEKRQAFNKRNELRRTAKAEAAQTGEALEALYQRWGCA